MKRAIDICDCCQQAGFAKAKRIYLTLCKDTDACLARTYAS